MFTSLTPSKLIQIIFVASLSILFFGCSSTKVSSTFTRKRAPIPYDHNILVSQIEDSITVPYQTLGTVSYGPYQEKITYKEIINLLSLEARKAGGNILKIIKQQPRMQQSESHLVEALVLYTDSIDKVNVTPFPEEEKKDVDYAILYIYRFPNSAGSLVNYNFRIRDSVLCKVKSNFKTEIQLKKEGMTYFCAETESKFWLPVDIEFGKEYYIRCSLTTGVVVGHPKLELIDWLDGKLEFENLNAKNQ